MSPSDLVVLCEGSDYDAIETTVLCRSIQLICRLNSIVVPDVFHWFLFMEYGANTHLHRRLDDSWHVSFLCLCDGVCSISVRVKKCYSGTTLDHRPWRNFHSCTVCPVSLFLCLDRADSYFSDKALWCLNLVPSSGKPCDVFVKIVVHLAIKDSHAACPSDIRQNYKERESRAYFNGVAWNIIPNSNVSLYIFWTPKPS